MNIDSQEPKILTKQMKAVSKVYKENTKF